jgi:hypothetical protein
MPAKFVGGLPEFVFKTEVCGGVVICHCAPLIVIPLRPSNFSISKDGK